MKKNKVFTKDLDRPADTIPMKKFEEVDIDSFLAEIKEDLDKFKSYWQKEQESEGSEDFPNKLLESEWFEQFLFFYKPY